MSAGYAAPGVKLKKRGLGEPGVLIVWGPLMVGGTYYAATGSIPGQVILASIPFALLSTTVLMGKHIDKLPWDGPANTRTLPVILGERTARTVTLGDDGRFLRRDRGARPGRCAPGVRDARVPRTAPTHAGVEGVHRAPARASRRRAIRCGRCGTRRSRSSTPGARAPCCSLGLAVAALVRSI